MGDRVALHDVVLFAWRLSVEYQLAVEQLSHERPAVSESARLDQLAYIGAVAVERSARELAYAELATAMRNDIGPGYVQTAMGAPIDGETDEDLKKLFEDLGNQ